MTDAPLVSVGIPSFNHSKFLPAAIESVLAQTYPNIELVIVDDGSTDGSLEVARGYASRYPHRVKVCIHAGHVRRGISATLNCTIRQSRGRYWCGFGSDDVFVPDKVERQVVFLERHPDLAMVYGGAQVIDQQGRATGEILMRDLSRERDPLRRLLEENFICASTVMIRSECLETVGLFAEHLMYGDWEQWIRILAHFQIGFLPRIVAHYRKHTTNSSVGQAVDVHLTRHLDVMKALEEKAPASGRLAHPCYWALIELQLAYFYFCASDHDAAARALEAAFEVYPSVFCDVRFLAGWLRRRQVQVGLFTRSPASDFHAWFGRRVLPLASAATSLSCGHWPLRSALFLAKCGIIARRACQCALGYADSLGLHSAPKT